MAIVKMKRFSLAALRSDREALLRQLMRMGCVELDEAADKLKQDEWAEKTRREESRLFALRSRIAEVKAAIDALTKVDHIKRPIFNKRPEVGEDEFFSAETRVQAMEITDKIQAYANTSIEISAEIERLKARIASLSPWEKTKAAAPLHFSEIASGDLGRLEARVNSLMKLDREEIEGATVSLNTGEGEKVLGEIERLKARMDSMSPQERAEGLEETGTDVPLNIADTRSCLLWFAVAPNTIEAQKLPQTLEERKLAAQLIPVNSDAEQCYFLFACLKDDSEAALELLRPCGFSRLAWKEYSRSAREHIEEMNAEIVELKEKKKATDRELVTLSGEKATLYRLIDILSAEAAQEEAKERLLATETVFFCDGWVPEKEMTAFQRLLGQYTTAYSFSDPDADDDVPISLSNSKIVQPFNMITEMYALPKYNNIDPNPLFALFYVVFFGIMFADFAYGLVLLGAGLFITRKFKPKGTMGYMFRLGIPLGLSCMFFGLMFGGFMGDFINYIEAFIRGGGVAEAASAPKLIPALFMDPMGEPIIKEGLLANNAMLLLVISLGIGIVHILFGMCVKVYLFIRDGKPLDALFDVGSWWLVFAGIAVLAMGGPFWVMAAGFAALILTQGRHKKGIFRKLSGGLVSLYDITAYMSDVLSYSRIMAISLAGGVMASVFNRMGSMLWGESIAMQIVGIVFFIIIALFGNLFNMGISVIGTYVHAARLQYLEFFSKFYDTGGRPFKPLRINTKYVDIQFNNRKEETL